MLRSSKTIRFFLDNDIELYVYEKDIYVFLCPSFVCVCVFFISFLRKVFVSRFLLSWFVDLSYAAGAGGA